LLDIVAGAVFPMWGLVFSEMISNMFVPVLKCSNGVITNSFPNMVLPSFDTCEDYFDYVADGMKDKSFRIAGYWAAIMVGCVLGNVCTIYGFGMASERLNKRVRDSSFIALMRQEVSYFGK
jgi:ATP-binding cassette, subfamily B (MDR/TAP), member 1